MRNWAGTIDYAAANIHRPTSVDELCSTVAASERIRALGTRHSFNAIADTTADLVSLESMPQTIDIDADADAPTVTVAAGVRYGELGVALQHAGWALPNMASLPHISVAGAVATATHGSGVANGGLATAVSAIELVTADGELRRLRRGDADFAGCVVGLGALGVVHRITLDIEPTYDVTQYVYDDMPWSEIDDEVLAGGYSVSVFTDWTGPHATTVWVKNRVAPGDRGGWSPPRQWHGARMADGPRHPIPGVAPEPATQQMGAPGPWHERLPHFRLDFTPSVGEEVQSEYLIAREQATDALAALGELRERIAPLLAITELRTVAADDLWLSMAYARDSLCIHFTWHPDIAAVTALLPAIEERLEAFAPRPHWGKVFTMSPERVAPGYERLDDFGRLRSRLDPEGKFGNAFTDSYAPAAR